MPPIPDVPGQAWLSRARLIFLGLLGAVQIALTAPYLLNSGGERGFWQIWFTWLGLAVIEWLWRHSRPVRQLSILTELAADALMLGGLVAATGGPDSVYTLFYALLVIAAALVLERRNIYILAVLCAASLALAIGLGWRGWLPGSWPRPANSHAALLSLILSMIALAVTAYLSSLLGAQLAATGELLRRQEQITASLRALNRNIMRSVTGGLISSDLDGRIYYANPAAEQILGRSIDAGGRALVQDVLGREIAQAPLSQRLEFPWREASGETRLLGLTVTSLLEGDQAVGRVYSFQDLTVLHRQERENRARDRMSALGRMATGLAHEIRNPLASLSGSVKLLARFAPLDAEEKQLAEIILKESERLHRVVSDFLAYARDRDVHRRRLDLGALLRELLQMAAHRAGSVPAPEIVADLGAAPIWILGDDDKLRQVFWNLLENAARAMPQGGRLEVSARPSAAGIRLEFRDHGCGLRPGTEETIFEPFNSEFPGGTGLGLATAYAIVEAHGGKIWAESPPGGGASFVLHLPLADPAAREQTAAGN